MCTALGNPFQMVTVPPTMLSTNDSERVSQEDSIQNLLEPLELEVMPASFQITPPRKQATWADLQQRVQNLPLASEVLYRSNEPAWRCQLPSDGSSPLKIAKTNWSTESSEEMLRCLVSLRHVCLKSVELGASTLRVYVITRLCLLCSDATTK
jgi:hypothetical protein